MLNIQIPGREMLTLSHLVLDYNGTIAKDGEIIDPELVLHYPLADYPRKDWQPLRCRYRIYSVNQ